MSKPRTEAPSFAADFDRGYEAGMRDGKRDQRAALVAAVDGLQPILVSGTDGKEFDSGWVSRANVLALLNTLPAAPTIDSAFQRVQEVLPEGWRPVTLNAEDGDWSRWVASTMSRAYWDGDPTRPGESDDDAGFEFASGPTPAAAFDALADALLHRGETGT